MAYGIDFMGLGLKNAVVVSAGPWSGNGVNIQKCIDAGAAAVITETISMEESSVFSPRVFYNDGEILNLSLYGRMAIEDWEAEFEKVNKKNSFLICSIKGSSPSEIAYIARRTERLGADALQIDIFAPMDAMIEQINIQPDKLYEMARAVVKSVNIPVMIRLPYHLICLTEYVKEIERAGISAISTIESLKGLSGVDIEKKVTKMPTYGGYTGRHIKPVALAATATLSQFTDCQIIGVGGVQDYTNILEFIMLGAVSAQLGSVVMLKGYGVITQIAAELDSWMSSHEYSGYDEIRGVALSSLTPFETPSSKAVCRFTENCNDTKCLICAISCVNGAITQNADGLSCQTESCAGCGLCEQRCPKGIISIENTQKGGG